MLFVTSLIALRVVGLVPRTTLACSMALQHLEVGAAVVDDDEGVWKKCQRTSELASVCYCTHHLGDAPRNRLGPEETGM
jgi:hypothetical protein